MDRNRVAGVVHFGDWDAEWVLRELAQRGPLVWLDSYAATYGPRRASHIARRGVETWPRPPRAYWQGVNSAVSAAIALRHIVRRQ